ncbi:hypothetical protein IW261DRAFT_1602436 [Armillaria novae-zelandiae]|uniref:Uncharacterized protein n=1 Tax=Armillaria novae-zelandiae TaxID=153914 RepID=A0AA39UI57_9AGAR|nr:hypothetical protein IW261DRAFT_1602436 [Armillaria novae-zelandiae]
MLFVITACIIQTLFVVWLSPSVSELFATTTGISWRWLDTPLVNVGLPKPNTTLTEIGDTFFQALATPADSSALQVVEVVTVLMADSPANELSDMDVRADDTPPQGVIWQLIEPAVAVVEVMLSATPSVDDTVPLVSVHPQPTQFPASVTRVRSRVSSSSSSSLIAPVSLFAIAIAIAVLVGFVIGFFARSVSLSTGWDGLPTLFVEVCDPSETIKSCVMDSIAASAVEADSGEKINEVVVEEVLVPEKAEHSIPFEATDSMASIPCGSVSSSDAVQPLRTSIGVQFTSDVCEIKDVSVGTEPASKTSVGIQCSMAKDEQTDISVGTSQPFSKISVGIQCSVATDEQMDEFTPGESRASLFMTAAEGTLPSQTTDGPDVLRSQRSLALTIPISWGPRCRFRRTSEDLVMSQRQKGAWHRPFQRRSLEYHPRPHPRLQLHQDQFRRSLWNLFHLWAREFWHRALRSEELIKILYEEVFPVDNASTDKDKYDMELGEGLVRISALRLSKHATNPILLLQYNVLPEDADPTDSLFVSAEANETMVSSSDSVGSRSPSPFVRPSNPQSRLLESSSSEASVAAPTPRNGLPSLSRIPTACRSRPALAEVTNTPRFVETTPSRTWTPMNAVRVRGAQIGISTPPPSVRPKLAKDGSRFPPVAPSSRRKDESDSPTRPARRGSPSSSKLPRWRG